MGATIKITTHVLRDRRVGQIVENPGLDSDATVQEAIDYGYVVGKKEVIKAQAEGVLEAPRGPSWGQSGRRRPRKTCATSPPLPPQRKTS